jgi:CheY-like chemotaxis protein
MPGIANPTVLRQWIPRTQSSQAHRPPELGVGLAPGRFGSDATAGDSDAIGSRGIADLLSDLGYRVLAAGDARSGLKILEAGTLIDLLVTDVGLPGGMNGRQLADAARLWRPNLKVLFITGYAESAAVGNGLMEQGTQVMTKPFALEALAARIQGIIGG